MFRETDCHCCGELRRPGRRQGKRRNRPHSARRDFAASWRRAQLVGDGGGGACLPAIPRPAPSRGRSGRLPCRCGTISRTSRTFPSVLSVVTRLCWPKKQQRQELTKKAAETAGILNAFRTNQLLHLCRATVSNYFAGNDKLLFNAIVRGQASGRVAGGGATV